MVARDYNLSVYSENAYSLYKKPFKEFAKWTIRFSKALLYKFSPSLYFRFHSKAGKHARLLPTNLTKQYLEGLPYYQIQIGTDTQPCALFHPLDQLHYNHHVKWPQDFVFGIAPLVDEIEQPHLKKWEFHIKITSPSKQKSWDLVFPYEDRNEPYCYKSKDGWINLKCPLDDFLGEEIQITIGYTHKTTQNKNLTSERWTLSHPQFLAKHPKNSIKNVVLFSMESLSDLNYLRSVYKAPALPHLDNFISENTSYQNVYAPADSTLAFAASMLTGLLPSQHSIGNYAIPADSFDSDTYNSNLESLPLFFKNKGFYTSFLGTQVRFSSKTGWARGFDQYFHVFEKWSPLVGQFEWINNQLHNMQDYCNFIYGHIDYLHDPMVAFHEHEKNRLFDVDLIDSTKNGKIAALYFAQLLELDRKFGQFIQTLKNMGLYDQTAIILTGDHGAGINWVKHNEYALYEERIRVPLVVKYPQWANQPLTPRHITNSFSEIHRVVRHLFGEDLPEYLKALPQFHHEFNSFAFSETIMNPRYNFVKHNLAMINMPYKYVCWNDIDWLKYKIIKQGKRVLYKWDAQKQMFDENSDVSFSNPDVFKKYEKISHDFILQNLNFLSLFPTEKF